MNDLFKRVAEKAKACVHHKAGNMAIMTAIFLPVALSLMAISVDTASLYLEKRKLQNLADLGAIAIASNIDDAEDIAKEFFAANGMKNFEVKLGNVVTQSSADPLIEVEKDIITIQPGRYTPDSEMNYTKRFIKDATPPNAVRVSIEKEGTLYFGENILDRVQIDAQGIAHLPRQAAFSIGSRLVRVEEGLINAVLGELFGSSVNLDVMDYNALLAGEIDLFPTLSLLAVKLDLENITYNQLLQESVTLAQLLHSMASASSELGLSRVLVKLANSGGADTQKLELSELFELGNSGYAIVGQDEIKLAVQIDVLSLFSALGAEIQGNKTINLNLDAEIPGITSVSAKLSIGEPLQKSPWFAVGEIGQKVTTRQTRLMVEIAVDGAGIQNSDLFRLPIYIEIARAEAALNDVACSENKRVLSHVNLNVRPGIAGAWIANINGSDLNSFHKKITPAKVVMLNLGLIKVEGYSFVEIGNTKQTLVKFTKAEIDAGELKTVTTSNYTQSLTLSLLNNLQLNIAGLDLGNLQLNAVKSILQNVVSPVTEEIDALLFDILNLVGVHLGQADVSVNGYHCGYPVLVQ